MFSIIVPVYKVEEYLNRCIESIIEQTYSDFELILVDDGSPDNCGRICDEYARLDKRIKVIHQSNQGVSAARNAGIKISTAEYICFVDPDDYVLGDFLMEFFKAIENNKPDIVVCGFTEFNKCHKKEVIFYDVDVNIIKKNMILYKWAPAVWNKCYKRSLFDDEVFPTGHYMEDLYLIPSKFLKADIIVCVNKSLYFYNIGNSKSIMKTMNISKEYDVFLGLKRLMDLQNNIKISNEERVEFINFIVKFARKLGYISVVNKKLSFEEKEVLLNFLRDNMKFIRGNIYIRISEKFLIKRLLNGDEWFCKLYLSIRHMKLYS